MRGQRPPGEMEYRVVAPRPSLGGEISIDRLAEGGALPENCRAGGHLSNGQAMVSCNVLPFPAAGCRAAAYARRTFIDKNLRRMFHDNIAHVISSSGLHIMVWRTMVFALYT